MNLKFLSIQAEEIQTAKLNKALRGPVRLPVPTPFHLARPWTRKKTDYHRQSVFSYLQDRRTGRFGTLVHTYENLRCRSNSGPQHQHHIRNHQPPLTNLLFTFFKHPLQIIRGVAPPYQLLQNCSHNIGSYLLLLSKEVVVEACNGDVFLLCRIAQAVNHERTSISHWQPCLLPSKNSTTYLRYVLPTLGFPEQNKTALSAPPSPVLHS